MQPGPQARDGQVVADDPFQGRAGRRPAGGLADGLGQGVVAAAAEQGHEPQRVEADRHHHPVEGQPFPALVVVDLHDDLGLDRLQVGDPPGQGADQPGPVEQLLDLDREHAPVGALEELAAVPLGQLPPAGGVGVGVHAFSVRLSPRV
jgi:hypothetical protein